MVRYELSGATTGSGYGDANAELFNPGTTTVSYTLEDDNGNTSQYQFTVTYQEMEVPVVSFADGTLTVENAGSYQWIDCEGDTIIDGETSSSFTPQKSGVYAVILSQGGCSDTSDCHRVTISGIGDEMQDPDFQVYPNPGHNYVTLDLGQEQTKISIKVVEMTGKILLIEEFDRLRKIDLDISTYKPGLYFIHIQSDQHSGVSKLIKE